MPSRHNRTHRRSLHHLVTVFICLPALLLCPSDAWSIEPGAESRTADYVALLRAVAARDLDETVRNPDYLARHFVRPYSRVEARRNSILMKGNFVDVKAFVGRGALGAYYYVNARTPHFDTVFKQALSEGLDQFVILGAGHDSRSIRFKEQLAGSKVFEIDLPGTQRQKQRTWARKIGGVAEHVIYVPIDFNTQSLGDVLNEAGYDPTGKTFFLWEGVTYYIEAQAVDATLRFVAQNSAPGSSIVFDYLLPRALARQNENRGSRVVRNRATNWGEPFLFGIEAEDTPAYLAERGLDSLTDLGPEELTERYLVRADGTKDGTMVDHWRIVHARVSGRPPSVKPAAEPKAAEPKAPPSL